MMMQLTMSNIKIQMLPAGLYVVVFPIRHDLDCATIGGTPDLRADACQPPHHASMGKAEPVAPTG